MRKMGWTIIVTTAILMVAAGCVTPPAPTVTPKFHPYAFSTDDYQAKVDGFLVILDVSSSMGEPYGEASKYSMALDFLNAMNQTLPEFQMDSALRTFGPDQAFGRLVGDLEYGVAPYRSRDFDAALEGVDRPTGTSPLYAALTAAVDDLAPMAGRLAVIVVSDGKNLSDETLPSARTLQNRYGDRLCMHTVLVGDDPAGEVLLREIAALCSCGSAVRADEFTTAWDMGEYVQEVFMAAGRPVDSDGDGVLDSADACPNTPAGASVDPRGCPVDSDGDGVYDYADECPNTPADVRVDARGCPIDSDGDGVFDDQDRCPGTPESANVNEVGCWVLENLHFDTGSAEIKPEAYPVLNETMKVLMRNPGLEIEIQGHTDNIGNAAFNRKLSEKRAMAVQKFFVIHGISADRLSAKGYGLERPVADNGTAAGRAKNRRVELEPIY